MVFGATKQLSLIYWRNVGECFIQRDSPNDALQFTHNVVCKKRETLM